MSIKLGAAVVGAILLAGSGVAEASPIHFTETTTASGTLGADSFTDAALTIDFFGDTAAASPIGATYWQIAPVTATVTIGGLGSATFTSSNLFAFDNHVGSIAGLADNYISILDTKNGAFGSYDLTTALAPVTGSSYISTNTFATTAGGFAITSAGDVTFAASITPANVPEPITLSIFGAGLVGAVAMRRHKLKV